MKEIFKEIITYIVIGIVSCSLVCLYYLNDLGLEGVLHVFGFTFSSVGCYVFSSDKEKVRKGDYRRSIGKIHTKER